MGRVFAAETIGIAAATMLVVSSESGSFVTVRQRDRQSAPNDIVAPSVSLDGRYVAFSSYARLVDSDADDRSDIYVLDRRTGVVTIESGAADVRANAHDSAFPRISGDGRFVAYETTVEGPALPRVAVVLRDRWRDATRLLQGEHDADGSSRMPAISADGGIVAFSSCATNLTNGRDLNGPDEDIYAYETSSGRIQRVSLTSAGAQFPTGDSFAPAVSADGRYIVFTSSANLDATPGAVEPSATRGSLNVYERDTYLNVTTRISSARSGATPNGRSYDAAVSGNGRYVAFVSDASNLVRQDDNGFPDVFLYDTQSRETTLMSRSVSGQSANGRSLHPAISADGGVIAFQSDASDLTNEFGCDASSKDINLVPDVFLFERASRTIRCISGGRQGWMEPSVGPAIDGAGAVVAFSSRHPVDGRDLENDFDLFVWTDVMPYTSRMSVVKR